MAAQYLKAETSDLFLNATLIFDRVAIERTSLVREDQELYQVRPAKRKLN
jgi:hypothetical protein